MANKIHIFGASGSGTSTLGQALAKQLPYTVMDSDDYYWETKFTVPREQKHRLHLLKQDLLAHEKFILSGAVCGWGDELKSMFDLVVFVYTPPEVRLERLKQREFQRYGEDILEGGSRYEQTKTFMAWASLYDEAGLEVRSKALHEQWMSDMKCPIIRLEGTHSVEKRVDQVLAYMKRN